MEFTPTLHKLSNGIPVILDDMDIMSAYMQVYFYTGSRYEKKSEYGITHFLEHILLKGTKKHPSYKSIQNYYDKYGAKWNAATNHDRIRLWTRGPAENMPKLIGIVSDQLQNSLFDSKVIENEKSVVLDEYRRRLDEDDWQFMRFSMKNIFAGSGYAHGILGTAENIKSFTRGQLLNYFKKMLSARNMVIAISGKIENKEKLLKNLETGFGWIPSFPVKHNDKLVVHPIIAHEEVAKNKNVKIMIGFENTVEESLKNKFQLLSQERFKAILRRRLFEQIRGQKGLVYGVETGQMGDDSVYVNAIETSTGLKNVEKVIALIAKECAAIVKSKPITKSEVKNIGNVIKLNCADFMESSIGRCGTLIAHYHQFGELYNLDQEMKMSEQITVPDVMKIAKKFFRLPVSIITQGPAIKTDLKKIWYDNFK